MPGADHVSSTAAAKASEALLAAQTEIDDLRWLMGDVRGRRFMQRLLTRSGIYRTSFNTDPLLMAFAEGRRNEGLQLLDEITQHCPNRLSDMQKEARTNERRNANGSTSR